MDKLASSAFRKYFAKLDAPTEVTVNGHPIGYWYPAFAPGVVLRENSLRQVAVEDIEDLPAAPVYPEAGSYFTAGDAQRLLKLTPKERQASRDAILRKINRGG